MFKILLNRKRLNDIANVARKNLKSSLHYTVPSVTQAVLSYDLSKAIASDPVLNIYGTYAETGNYRLLYTTENSENVLNIPKYFDWDMQRYAMSIQESSTPSIIHYPKCSYIGERAFNSFAALQKIVFDECQIIGNRAFEGCVNLNDVSFPKCTLIKYGAFNNCTSLQDISFPECIALEPFAFYNCIVLRSIYMPKLKAIPYEGFNNRSFLRSVYFQDCAIIGSYAFNKCTQLNYVELPNCLYIGKYAFRSCVALSSIVFNSSPYIDEHAFEYASDIRYISFASCTKICNFAFYNCEKLESIMLLGETIPMLDGSMIFAGTPLAIDYSGVRSCKMYVRESLFSQYVEVMASVMNTDALAVYE